MSRKKGKNMEHEIDKDINREDLETNPKKKKNRTKATKEKIDKQIEFTQAESTNNNKSNVIIVETKTETEKFEDSIETKLKSDSNKKEASSTDKPAAIHTQLIFELDKDGRNYISKLSCGKTTILHRNDKTIPERGVAYNCVIQEKDDYALAWIIGIANYPRVIPRLDGRFIYVESPHDKGVTFATLRELFETIDREVVSMIYRKEARLTSTSQIETKPYEISIEVKGDGKTIKKDLQTRMRIDETPADIIAKVESCIKY